MNKKLLIYCGIAGFLLAAISDLIKETIGNNFIVILVMGLLSWMIFYIILRKYRN